MESYLIVDTRNFDPFKKWCDYFGQLNYKNLAKGRTNIELREQFILADGVSQSMTAFKPKTPSSAQRNTSFSGSAGPITKVGLNNILLHNRIDVTFPITSVGKCTIKLVVLAKNIQAKFLMIP